MMMMMMMMTMTMTTMLMIQTDSASDLKAVESNSSLRQVTKFQRHKSSVASSISGIVFVCWCILCFLVFSSLFCVFYSLWCFTDGYWHRRTNAPSLRSLLVVEERMRSNWCFQHWLAPGMTSDHKISAPISPGGMYFPSTLNSAISLSVWEGHGGMVSNVLVGPERMHMSRMNGHGESRGNRLTQVQLEG